MNSFGACKTEVQFPILRLCFAVLAFVVLSPCGLPTASQQQAPPADGKKLTFEVVSIHEWGKNLQPKGRYAAGVQFSSGRVFSTCASLSSLLFFAYHLTWATPPTGLPSWGDAACGEGTSQTYAIEATMPVETTVDQAREMMQNLLLDRFKLAVHWEEKQAPIYAMVVRSGGFKGAPVTHEKEKPPPPGSIGCPSEDPGCHIYVGTGPLSALAAALTSYVGRPVVDRTGIAGEFDLTIKLAGDQATESPLPSLPAALREQFNLELKSDVGPVRTLVVDHVEKPSPN